MQQLIECVPNISEGIDGQIIDSICEAITSVIGVQLLHIDSGVGANRTVLTFAGEPSLVVESAFRMVRVAGELIDMRRHKGAHPRLGSTDVLPLIPIRGITLKQTAQLARSLARRIADELFIPTYCYEASATEPKRKNLANIREGEYESLPIKLSSKEWHPDYGSAKFTEKVAQSGVTVVGAREILIAVNFNLNTKSVDIARTIAADVRESGRVVDTGSWREGSDGLWYKTDNAPSGDKLTIHGKLKGCKAIGWFIEEYGMAQVSINITDINIAPLHKVFEEVSSVALLRGFSVTGTEIVGLVPLNVVIDAGRYFASRQHLDKPLDEKKMITLADKNMNLSQLTPFNPQEKIIEYILKAGC